MIVALKYFNPITKQSNGSRGFTLIELMIVVIIIGILAVVALPTYNKYLLQSKMAESYVAMDTMKKHEISYFNESKTFVSTQTNPNAGGVPPYIMEECTGSNCGWHLLGYPFTPGSQTYFMYRIPSGQVDNDGTEHVNDFDGNPISAGSHSDQISFGFNGMRCTSTLTLENLGITFGPNSHWAVMTAGSNFKGAPSPCTMVIQVLTVVNDSLKANGIILLDVGE